MRFLVVVAGIFLSGLAWGSESEENIALASRLKNVLLDKCSDRIALNGRELIPVPPRFLVEIFESQAAAFLKDKSLNSYVDLFELWAKGELPSEFDPYVEEELGAISSLFSNFLKIAGTKERTEFWGMDYLTKDLRAEILRLVLEQWQKAPSQRSPLRFRIVGLGIANGEYEHLVRWLGPIFDSLEGPGKRDSIAQTLDVRFNLYDRRLEILEGAEKRVAQIEASHSWLSGRTRISFADLAAGGWFRHWGRENTVLAMSRNTLRHELVTLHTAFLEEAGDSLVDDGVLVLGPEEGYFLREIYREIPPLGYLYYHAASIDLGMYEESAEIFRRYRRYRSEKSEN